MTAGTRNYAIVTAAYWGFTLTDGALRLLVLFHFFKLGYSPFTLSLLFLLYEAAGIAANFVGGWLLPVLAQMTALAPCFLAIEIAVVMPRSLNDAVGLSPSNLTSTVAPVSSESPSQGMSGVPPSWRVTTGAPSSIGRRSAYSRITPRHR